MLDKNRYIIVFVITLILFAFAFLLSDKFSNTKIDKLKEIQEKISLDILSIETRYSLLGSSSCQHVIENQNFEQGLNEELSNLAKRVKFMESELGPKNTHVIQIKQQYNLLQIKDYILRQELNTRCGGEVLSILYFHAVDCEACKNQSIVLDELSVRYPEVRIYWLDRDLKTPAMETLVSMFGVTQSPAILVDDVLVKGFQSVDMLEKQLPKDIVEEYYKSISDEDQTETQSPARD